jgi:glycosyltransferase involved in cell wall biosynthesis
MPGVALSVVTSAPAPADDAAFARDILDGLDVLVLPPDRREDLATVREWLIRRRPGALAVGGWGRRLHRRLIVDPAFRPARKLLFMDNVLRGDARQWLGRWLVRRYLERIDAVLVPGERAAAFARFLGLPSKRVVQGGLGIDFAALAPLLGARSALAGGWPRRFLFLGRYAPDKGLDVLVEAYRTYRGRVTEPWELVFCGAGSLGRLLAGQDGIVDRGFRQPSEARDDLLHAGAFVLPSRREPWGVALAEACAAGLPIVSSDACGASAELLRDWWNGVRVTPGSTADLAAGLAWVHAEAGRAPSLGRRSQALAAPFAATSWAERVLHAARG